MYRQQRIECRADVAVVGAGCIVRAGGGPGWSICCLRRCSTTTCGEPVLCDKRFCHADGEGIWWGRPPIRNTVEMNIADRDATMNYVVTDEFDCSPEELWELLEDNEEFTRRLEQQIEETRQTEQRHTEDGEEVRRIRCISRRDIPELMKKALGIERLEYEREQRLDRGRGVMHWEVTTPFLAERVDATGTTRVEVHDGGCRRRVTGQVEIQLPVVGSKMEGKLADKLREADEAAAAIAREMLDEQ